jgi:hypothetical protein
MKMKWTEICLKDIFDVGIEIFLWNGESFCIKLLENIRKDISSYKVLFHGNLKLLKIKRTKKIKNYIREKISLKNFNFL